MESGSASIHYATGVCNGWREEGLRGPAIVKRNPSAAHEFNTI